MLWCPRKAVVCGCGYDFVERFETVPVPPLGLGSSQRRDDRGSVSSDRGLVVAEFVQPHGDVCGECVGDGLSDDDP